MVIFLNITQIIGEWKESFFYPERSIPKQSEKANLKNGIKNVIIAHLIFFSISYLLIILRSLMDPSHNITNEESTKIYDLFLNLVYSIFVFFVGAGIIWAFVKILGGSSQFGTHLYFLSTPLALTLISFLFVGEFINLFIPIVSRYHYLLLSAFVMFHYFSLTLLGLIYLTSIWIAIKEINKFSDTKAFFSVFISFLLFSILSLNLPSIPSVLSNFANSFFPFNIIISSILNLTHIIFYF